MGNMVVRTVKLVGAGVDKGPVAFGIAELGRELSTAGYTLDGAAPLQVVLARPDDTLFPAAVPCEAESYAIARPAPDTIILAGHDSSGLMYACLDLAEQLAASGDLSQVQERRCQPDLQLRGLYTFLHNSEAERDWLYDAAYWQGYADELARCRFNRFNLIYGHQSPHLIPIYAFLLDELDEAFPDIRVQGITPEERSRNLRALRNASVAMVGRGLRFFLGIWNSRPWTITNGVWENQPTRVTGTDDLGMLADYTRQGFTRLIDLCPAIGGIQLRMNIESGIGDQRFFVQSFVPALVDLAARGRRLAVELRNWGLHPDTIEAFRGTGLDIVVSTKYFAEHQAMPYQPPVMRGSYSYDSFLRRDKPFPFQWHVWNLGSHRLFNWGDPDYVRQFARSCRLGDGVGFEVTPPGSQKGFSQWGQVTPGDWQARADLPPRPDYQRYWFFHLAYGRLTYDSTTPDDLFLRQLAARTSAQAAPVFLAAYRAASKVISFLISQRMDDPNMYVWPELDAGGPIDHNLIAPPGEVTLFSTPREHAEDRAAGRATAKLSPFDCQEALGRMADQIEARLGELAALPGLPDNREYRTVRVDFAALAALARYHAAKAAASGNLALFYETGEQRFLDAAEGEAARGVLLWDVLCTRTEVYYGELHLGPSGGHWRDNLLRVRYDLKRIQRVRQLFDAHGLYPWGLDLGPAVSERSSPRTLSGLEVEPRFHSLDPVTRYSAERGYGWLRPAGLRAVGPVPLSSELLWGVHNIRPGAPFDPAIVDALPLEALAERYIEGRGTYTLRVDVPDGDYELTLIAPRVSGVRTMVRVGEAVVEVRGVGTSEARLNVHASDGVIEIAIGDERDWALAGVIVRPCAPVIAHLPAYALPGESRNTLYATVTCPQGVRLMALRYRSGSACGELPMTGDGRAFYATLPDNLTGDRLHYALLAKSVEGLETVREYDVPLVHSFRPPRIVQASGPERWSRGDEIIFRATLEHGEYAREVRLHYREADQNRAFRMAAQPGGRAGEYEFHVDLRYLDDAYELIYYWEVIDVLGGGSFYPDPWTEARYRICPPRPSVRSSTP
jgi:hypothetical protein